MSLLEVENPRAVIGGNEPPEPTPFEAVSTKIADLFLEAKNWCDGEPLASQAQADEVGKLVDMIRKAAKEADALRVEEVKPLDEQKAAIQARYAPLIADTKSVKGKTVLALDACKAALAPWLKKLDEEKQAAARKAREEAEAAQRAAQEAFRQAERNNLAAVEAAEALHNAAQAAEKAAKRAENDMAQVSGGSGRRVSLRSVWTAELSDSTVAARHYWQRAKPEIETLLRQLASEDVRAGVREIPGFRITEDKVPV